MRKIQEPGLPDAMGIGSIPPSEFGRVLQVFRSSVKRARARTQKQRSDRTSDAAIMEKGGVLVRRPVPAQRANQFNDGPSNTWIGDFHERLVELKTFSGREKFDHIALGRTL